MRAYCGFTTMKPVWPGLFGQIMFANRPIPNSGLQLRVQTMARPQRLNYLRMSSSVPRSKACRALAAPETLWILAGGDTTLRAADNNPIQIGRESGVVSESDGVASGPQWNRYGCAGRNRETGATQRQLQSRAPVDADRERPGTIDQIVDLHPVVAVHRRIHIVYGDEIGRTVTDKAHLLTTRTCRAACH